MDLRKFKKRPVNHNISGDIIMKVQYDENAENVTVTIHVTRLKNREEMKNIDVTKATVFKRCVNPITYQPEIIIQAETDPVTNEPRYYIAPLELSVKDEDNE